MCSFNGPSGRPDDANLIRINNSMQYTYNNDDDYREVTLVMTVPQGREPFHPRKLQQKTGSFMSPLYHERDMENKDRGLTDSSGSGPPIDAADHRC